MKTIFQEEAKVNQISSIEKDISYHCRGKEPEHLQAFQITKGISQIVFQTLLALWFRTAQRNDFSFQPKTIDVHHDVVAGLRKQHADGKTNA